MVHDAQHSLPSLTSCMSGGNAACHSAKYLALAEGLLPCLSTYTCHTLLFPSYRWRCHTSVVCACSAEPNRLRLLGLSQERHDCPFACSTDVTRREPGEASYKQRNETLWKVSFMHGWTEHTWCSLFFEQEFGGKFHPYILHNLLDFCKGHGTQLITRQHNFGGTQRARQRPLLAFQNMLAMLWMLDPTIRIVHSLSFACGRPPGAGGRVLTRIRGRRSCPLAPTGCSGPFASSPTPPVEGAGQLCCLSFSVNCNPATATR